MERQQPILVTGGAGFIGSNFVQDWLKQGTCPVVNLDLLTYAGNLGNLEGAFDDAQHTFVQGSISDRALLSRLMAKHKPWAVVNFAAESHVDRSILGPDAFLRTNIEGTFALLEATREYLANLRSEQVARFRFLHVSTDEVYGSLQPGEAAFTETTPYAPNSPYAASKASSDMLVRAWHHTYGLPTLISNCSNNYGPRQLPEKLIPLVLTEALAGRPLPVYGDGQQVRDWLYVDDHNAALRTILDHGQPGSTYNVGGGNEQPNLMVVQTICRLLDELVPESAFRPHAQLIRFVTDRPGHDRRYAVDAGKLRRELGWYPAHTFADGLRATIEWYLNHAAWLEEVRSGEYRHWMERNYAGRDGMAANEAVKPADSLSSGERW